MNLVDMLKSQLVGEAGKKLAGMMGANESETEKILSFGLPSILSGLGSLASSKIGADKLGNAIGSIDTSSFGDLSKMLDSKASSNGGSLLTSLMGGGVVDGIAAAISRFTGIDVAMVKMALGYLTPMVLGSIGASLQGGKVDSTGISKLFHEQKNNIASAMPAGFSLDSVPGIQALAGNVHSVAQQSPAEAPGEVGKFLVPLAVLAAAGAAAFFYFNNKSIEVKDVVKGLAQVEPDKVDGAKSPVESKATEVVAGAKTALGGVDSLKSAMSDLMAGLFSKLEGIQDVASAEAAVPAIKESIGKLDGFATVLNALPAEGKSMVSALVKSQLDKLNPLMEKIASIPGIGDAIKTILEQLKDKLSGMVG
jgi:hypothetical protein